MTWSLAYSQSFTTAGNLASGLGPWEYHFETWLPTKGWTISEDEDGGIGSGPYGSTQSKFYGVEKTFTNAAGNTYDFKYIVELNFGFRYVIYYPWTGVAGAGAGLEPSCTSALLPCGAGLPAGSWR